MVISLLHKMQAPYNFFTLSLCDSNSCKSNSWRDDNDGDQGVKPVTMEIMMVLWDGDQRHKMMMAISCHIFLLHVMFIFYASYFA